MTTIAITPQGNPTTETRMRGIARELARDIMDREEILKTYGVSEKEFDTLLTSRVFAEMYRAEVIAWNDTQSSKERIELKTLAIVEESLLTMHGYLHDPKFSDSAKVELFKALQKGVGIGVNQQQATEGQKVSITINMGADRQMVVEHQRPTIEAISVEDQ